MLRFVFTERRTKESTAVGFRSRHRKQTWGQKLGWNIRFSEQVNSFKCKKVTSSRSVLFTELVPIWSTVHSWLSKMITGWTILEYRKFQLKQKGNEITVKEEKRVIISLFHNFNIIFNPDSFVAVSIEK